MNKNGNTIKKAKYETTFKVSSNTVNLNDINLIMALNNQYPEIEVDVTEIGVGNESVS